MYHTLESLDSDSSRTWVPILLDSDSNPTYSRTDLDSDSRHADSDSTRTVGVGTRPDSENCTVKESIQVYLTPLTSNVEKLKSEILETAECLYYIFRMLQST